MLCYSTVYTQLLAIIHCMRVAAHQWELAGLHYIVWAKSSCTHMGGNCRIGGKEGTLTLCVIFAQLQSGSQLKWHFRE